MKRERKEESDLTLPSEIWVEIGRWLHFPDALQLTATSKFHYELLTKMTLFLGMDYTGNDWSSHSIGIESFKRLTELQSLELANCETITDEDIKGLTRLTSLNLVANREITDRGLCHLTNLTKLKLENNFQITGQSLTLLTNLTSLNLDLFSYIYSDDFDSDSDSEDIGNQIQPIGNKELTCLQSLIHLSIVGNKTITHDGLSVMTNLKSLCLGRCDRTWNRNLIQLTQIEVLKLVNDLAISGKVIAKMTNLKSLRLCGQNLIWCGDIMKFTNLTSLDISKSHLKIKDKTLFNLTNLTCLNIGRECPNVTYDSISRLTRLRELYLDCGSEIILNHSTNLTNIRNIYAICSCKEHQ